MRSFHVILPACRVDPALEAVLDGVAALSPAPTGVTLADDGSVERGVSMLAAARGLRATREQGDMEPPRGPAAARNHAARQVIAALGGPGDAAGEAWLVFIDADVVPEPNVLEALDAAIGAAAEAEVPASGEGRPVVAVLGAYTDQPPHPATPSRYANLRHHFMHLTNPGPVSTFWAGLGAVRADAFASVGGFDAAAYPRPSIEDIELGMRLHAAGGRLVIDPSVRGTHLKKWTHRNLWRTEIRDRAWPWARLLRACGDGARPLNLGRRQQLSAAAAGLGLLCPPIFWLAERRFLRFFRRRHTLAQTLHAALLHQAHFIYSAVVFVAADLWPLRPPHEDRAPKA